MTTITMPRDLLQVLRVGREAPIASNRSSIYWSAALSIGEVPGVAVGTTFPNRHELSKAGVHRATQAGITGGAETGAESIVLSGGYVDDLDEGNVVIYTGHGGRDPATGHQVSDQVFSKQNKALVTSCLGGLPVRVIRGATKHSTFAPASGYRYDGLYQVESYWTEIGKAGFRICRFRLIQDITEVSVPATTGTHTALVPTGIATPKRAATTLQRVVRDTQVGRWVKTLYGCACQVCGIALTCEGGLYAEAAHIRPLGKPHNGPDVVGNVLCLCPNHHVQFDNGGFVINDDLKLQGIDGELKLNPRHALDFDHLRYHRTMWKS